MSTSKGIPVEELRQLKALLDDGIITEKEFSEKKEQLLNLAHDNDARVVSVGISQNETKDNPPEKMSDQYMWSIRYDEEENKEVYLDSAITVAANPA